jgi:hypothetical protein
MSGTSARIGSFGFEAFEIGGQRETRSKGF